MSTSHTHVKPKLQVTRNYDLFEMHPLNRDLQEKPILLASMKEHGFMPSSPIQCIPNGRGTLKVLRGHHRLHYAKRLKLPVWYVIDPSNTDIYSLEGNSQTWTLEDFIVSRAKAGDEQCSKVLAFRKKHEVPLGIALSLLGGESAQATGKSNYAASAKRGTFRLAADQKHTTNVIDVVEHFRSLGVAFATRASFVAAVSRILRVPECDPSVLKHRLTQAPALIQRRTSTDGYIDELEGLYNYGAKGRRLPLAFRAREVFRERKENFGRNPKRVARG